MFVEKTSLIISNVLCIHCTSYHFADIKERFRRMLLKVTLSSYC